jgi:hypothetical protein
MAAEAGAEALRAANPPSKRVGERLKIKVSDRGAKPLGARVEVDVAFTAGLSRSFVLLAARRGANL